MRLADVPVLGVLLRRRSVGHAAVRLAFERDHPSCAISWICTRAIEEHRVVVLVYYEQVGRSCRPGHVACYAVPTDRADELPYVPDSPYYIRGRK